MQHVVAGVSIPPIFCHATWHESSVHSPHWGVPSGSPLKPFSSRCVPPAALCISPAVSRSAVPSDSCTPSVCLSSPPPPPPPIPHPHPSPPPPPGRQRGLHGAAQPGLHAGGPGHGAPRGIPPLCAHPRDGRRLPPREEDGRAGARDREGEEVHCHDLQGGR